MPLARRSPRVLTGFMLRWIIPASVVLLVSVPAASRGAECGASGNTFWTYSYGTTPAFTQAAVGDSGVYIAAGTKLTLLRLDGTLLNSRDFITVVLVGRPLFFRLHGGPDAIVVVAGSDGYVYGLDPITLATQWSKSLKRGTCSADGISASSVIQLWDSSDPAFRANDRDVLIVGTDYHCGTTTTNKVFGLNPATGTTVWVHNGLATYAYDAITGLAVDYARDKVYVTAKKTNPETPPQATLVALSTIDGARLWHQNYGPIGVPPVLIAGHLYVVNTAGTLASVDEATGSALHSMQVASSGTSAIGLSAAYFAPNVWLFVLDSGGTLHALVDACNGGPLSAVWGTDLSGAKATSVATTLPISGRVYVGAGNGRVYQLNPNTGLVDSYATVGGASDTSYEPMIWSRGRLLAFAGTTARWLCVPWLADGGDKALLLDPPGMAPASGALGLAIGTTYRESSIGRMRLGP